MIRKNLIYVMMAIALVVSQVCFAHEEKEHQNEAPDHHEAEGGHEHEESSSGASFKAGEGVILSEETKKILNVETVPVAKENLPRITRFNIQLYGNVHRFAEEEDHLGCDSHGAGFIPNEKAALIHPKAPVIISSATGRLEGFVVSVQGSPALGESEVVVGVKKGEADIKDGEFATATIMEPRNEEAIVIPRQALLTTIEGTYVYRVNGDAYLRVPVKPGSEAEDKIEILEGLNSGDEVVTNAVETLRLIELRSTKGGGHSH